MNCPVKRFVIVSCIFLGIGGTVSAGNIKSLIQDYPGHQFGASGSDPITTDGAIGNLSGDNRLSWNETVTPSGATPITLTVSGLGSEDFKTENVGAPSVDLAEAKGIVIPLVLFKYPHSGVEFEAKYQHLDRTEMIVSESLNSKPWGNEPQIIASVPEPFAYVIHGMWSMTIAIGIVRMIKLRAKQRGAQERPETGSHRGVGFRPEEFRGRHH